MNIEIIGIIILIATWIVAKKEYEEMECHIMDACRLPVWASIYGIEWMDGESLPAFKARVMAKIRPPRHAPGKKAEAVEVLQERGITNCTVVESGHCAADIFVDPENVEAAQNIADFEFAVGIQWKARLFEGAVS